MGCFKDAANRALSEGNAYTDDMTNEVCFEICWQQVTRAVPVSVDTGTKRTN